MTNIGEALTTRLARERLEAIKKIIPVRDSVKQKLKARQEAKVEFAEGAEELFKPVTAVTETVKTAITGKVDPKDPDKPQLSLLQAIEGLKKEQSKAIRGFNWKTDFLDNVVTGIKAIPITNFAEAEEFGKRASAYYHEKEADPEQEMTKQKFLDGLYKINRNMDRLDTKSEIYKGYMKGVIDYDSEVRRNRVGKGKKKSARGKPMKFSPQGVIGPKVEEFESDPASEFLSRELKEEDDDFGISSLSSPTTPIPNYH